MKRVAILLTGLLVVAAVVLAWEAMPTHRHAALDRRLAAASHARGGIHKIRHVVIIMQENRSFDSYFGTYPGADGIPGLAGNPGTVPCNPDPKTHACVKPYHDTRESQRGRPTHHR